MLAWSLNLGFAGSAEDIAESLVSDLTASRKLTITSVSATQALTITGLTGSWNG